MPISDGPVYQQALDVRMLYSVCETFFGYFLAALTLAPVGGLCPEDATAIGLKADAECRPEMIETGLEFWQRLISD